MDHQNLEKLTSATLMLPKEGTEKVVIISPRNGSVGKILLREDTVLAGLPGCAGCGRAHFNCAGMKEQWSALCWGKWDRKYYCLLLILSTSFVLSLIGTIVFTFTNTLNDAILSSMVIKNNTMAFRMWQRPAVQPLLKVHLFNYTNWERVRDGLDEKFVVDDVGPFVYRQEVERVNIQFKGDKLSYQERNNFKYLPEKSNGAAFDQIYVPNLPLLGVVSKAVDILNSMAQITLSSALTWANHPEAFVKLPIHRFLWGYDDSIINTAKPILSIQGQLKFERFGLLVTRNGTVDDRMTINTGENDIDKINIIETVNGERQLSFWGSAECNSVEASDGSIFPPSLLDRKTILKVFFPNLCRRLPFHYEKDVETEDGISLLRYRFPENVFDDPARNPANACYCEIDSGLCPPRGVMNVTACAMGAPALVSFPHFYNGDPKLREDILGLHPDPKQHDSFLDIHPKLGIALNAKSSLQINIQVRKTPLFPALGFLPDHLILPIAWLEVSVEELPESLQSLIYHGTYSTAAAQLALIISSATALVISTLCLVILVHKRRREPCMTLKKVGSRVEIKQ